ncbi:class V chitinase-like isoform X2 [Prosopis cineraria]|nr:class V chitinase-like isoform X2 [Prosopis cineraria]XP_054805960.1 class V chitinase-like isoform X2 [Prosopis cineraria]
MVSNQSSRRSFIASSVGIAKAYEFDGLDLYCDYPEIKADMDGMAILLQEWRQYVHDNDPELILTATIPYSPYWPFNKSIYPVESMARYLDRVHVKTYSYILGRSHVTAAHSALFDPSSRYYSTDYGINEWISRGLSPNKLVLGLAYFGYAWNLTDPNDNAIGAPATGQAQAQRGSGKMTYGEINDRILSRREGDIQYNDTYVINYWSCGSTWIGFDDVEAIKIKVSNAKEKKLLGYASWQVSDNDNWLLSYAAKGEDNKVKGEHYCSRLLKILLAPAVLSVLLLVLGFLVYSQKRRFKLKENKEAAEHLNGNATDVKVISFSDILRATNGFSIENKIGEGGFGVVYKGILPDGEEIAVKRRSKGSKQGFEEFKNETTLNARLQHVNLVRLLGFCNDREEQMLVYEYMPNKSLHFYLFDPTKQHLLDWRQRVGIIERVTQGLIYLQEYSRLTIIHRDLKVSNILLDHEMKPRISDFGMARPFKKDVHEENASKLVGT